MESIVLLLGSNLGKRKYHLGRARKRIELALGPIYEQSSIYETEAWGMSEQTSSFLNQVIITRSAVSPETVLEIIERIEDKPESKNDKTYRSRLLDIDILFYGNRVIHEDHLHIPHPLIPKRNFVLVPLLEIMPEFVHPELNQTIKSLYDQTDDDCKVSLIS